MTDPNHPTINTVIERVCRVMPNPLDEETLARHLMSLDGRIFNITRPDAPEILPPLFWPMDAKVPLLIGSPYDIIYDHYLTAMIAWHMQEYEVYNNAADMFRSALARWKAHYRRTHRPKGQEVIL